MRRKPLVLAMFIGLIYGAFGECLAQRTAVKPPTSSEHYDGKEFVSEDGTKLAYWLMTPEQTEAGMTYPLVRAVVIHQHPDLAYRAHSLAVN